MVGKPPSNVKFRPTGKKHSLKVLWEKAVKTTPANAPPKRVAERDGRNPERGSMRILIAEDDAVSRRMLQAQLERWGHEVIVTSDGAQALSALSCPDSPRLAILDWIMPGLDGLGVTKRVREMPDRPLTYILLLTSKDQKEDIVSALDSGADDYLVKPYDAEELRSRIGAGLRILGLQEQLERLNQQLAEQARTDYLTQLPNRRAVLEHLASELGRCARVGTPLLVMMVDIDYFKRINDTHGHAAGDSVLTEVARRLTTHVRLYDAVGRMGGEEFLIVVPDIALEQAAATADRIRQTLSDTPIPLDGKDLHVTASIGVAWAHPDDSGAFIADLLIRTADAQLYQAKTSGRNRVCVTQV